MANPEALNPSSPAIERLFPQASLDMQYRAGQISFEVLYAYAQMTEQPEAEHPIQMIYSYLSIEGEKGVTPDVVHRQQQLFISVSDMFFGSDIGRATRPQAISFSAYQREFGRPPYFLDTETAADSLLPLRSTPQTIFYMTPNELQKQMTRGQKESVSVDEAKKMLIDDYLLKKRQRLMINQTVNYGDLSVLAGEWYECRSRISMLVPFVLNETCAGIALFDDNNEHAKVIYPRSELPRQDIWRSYLRAGIPPVWIKELFEYITSKQDTFSNLQNFFAKHESNLHISEGITYEMVLKELFKHSENPRQRMEIRKNLYVFPETAKQSNTLLEKQREHMATILWGEANDDTIKRTWITRSGVSANEVAFHLAKRLLENSDMNYTASDFSGWYFENPLSPHFNSSSVSGARIFCVNNDPTVFIDENLITDPDIYDKRRDEKIHEFLTNARRNFRSTYILIYDATTNPFWSYQETMPKNVLLIKTISMTKHQRGGQHFFGVFGWEIVPGNDKISITDEMIQESMNQSMANPTAETCVQFPLIRRSEIQTNLTRIRELEEEFIETFARTKAYTEGWRIYRSAMSMFLIPPLEPIRTFVAAMPRDVPQSPLGKYPYEHLSYALFDTDLLLNKGFLISTIDITDQVEKDKLPFVVERSDSFGFPYTAVNMGTLRIKFDPHDSTAYFLLTSVIRIHPGYENTTEEMNMLAQTISHSIEEHMPKS